MYGEFIFSLVDIKFFFINKTFSSFYVVIKNLLKTSFFVEKNFENIKKTY